MSTIEKYQVLDHVIATLKNALADVKVENPLPGEYRIIDGNDEIYLKQVENGEENTTILITDKRRIIYSEDLLEPLKNMHKEIKGDDALQTALQSALLIINELDIETELVLQAIKDFFDQLSNSYEFIQTVENKITQIGAGFKFGKHIFRININNLPQQIFIEPRFSPSFDPTVQKTVTEDILKVQTAVNKMFKKES